LAWYVYIFIIHGFIVAHVEREQDNGYTLESLHFFKKKMWVLNFRNHKTTGEGERRKKVKKSKYSGQLSVEGFKLFIKPDKHGSMGNCCYDSLGHCEHNIPYKKNSTGRRAKFTVNPVGGQECDTEDCGPAYDFDDSIPLPDRFKLYQQGSKSAYMEETELIILRVSQAAAHAKCKKMTVSLPCSVYDAWGGRVSS
jgi:hypothetical protein